jgi:dihydrofolate synthase/folylpolyglutamate synthase
VTSLVVTTNGSPRAMGVDALAEIAVEVFGEDRVEVAARLDDAIDVAVAAAESEAQIGGAGVVVTGSIVTVGEARHLLRRRT